MKVWCTLPIDFRIGDIDNSKIVQKSSYTDVYEAIRCPDSMKVLELHLTESDDSEMPELVFHFPNLEVLDMKKTGLESVPQAITKLQQLETLDISDNHLKGLPEELWTLPFLQFIVVKGNRFPASVRRTLEKEHGGLLYPKDEKGRVQW
ncbi:MAG: hypothetical protein U0176_23955 [Bacteroidia bacterium]